MRPSLALRVGAILFVAAALAPFQALAVRRGWPAGRRIPVLFHRILLRLLRVRVTVLGAPPPAGTPVLVLANHVSWLDIPVLAAAMPLSFVAKSEVAGWPIIGALARLQRCVFVERGRKSATAEVNALVAKRLGAGEAIVLFPEGTTGDGTRLLPFRSSLVGAAQTALVDHMVDAIRLQPLAITYRRRRGLPLTRREMPEVAWYGDMELAPHLAALIRGGPLDVALAWGEPIAFDAAIDRKAAAAAAERQVGLALEKIRRGGRSDSP
jgi:1-acyl-sn-glycerol-3-phosphate acyltransferase